MLYAMRNCMLEWPLTSGRRYEDPFNEIELSAIVTEPDGEERVLPAFWAGECTWRIRYASSKVGRHHFRTVCTDTSNIDLHDKEGDIEIVPYEGDNPLLKHGPLRVSGDRRHLEHSDGTPFFWLGDTWWMGLTKRLRWPEDFQFLTADRVKKGFSVIQIVAGLYPDMVPFDERGANEGGFPWERDYKRINPAYFDMADLRIGWLVRSGLVPCIVGCWGYFLEFAGADVLKKHWRYLVARYGAYPVVWCMAGEAVMPFYGSVDWSDEQNKKYSLLRSSKEKREEYVAWARAGWTDLTAYVRSIDPYHRPITIHPTDFGHKMVSNPSLLDIDMLQTGHGSWNTLARNSDMVEEALSLEPPIPVVVGEVCYEGIGGSCGPEIQRFLFWANMLGGAAGHTYGANGIWQVNTREKPYGPSPHGMAWGHTPWEDAYLLPGSKHVGIGKRFLERYPWWRFEPHPEWADPHASKGNRIAPYAAGIPGEVRVIYVPLLGPKPVIKGIESDVSYRAFFFDPATGDEYDLGEVIADKDGCWQFPNWLPLYQDLVLVLERRR